MDAFKAKIVFEVAHRITRTIYENFPKPNGWIIPNGTLLGALTSLGSPRSDSRRRSLESTVCVEEVFELFEGTECEVDGYDYRVGNVLAVPS